jgi:altronate hydrolase
MATHFQGFVRSDGSVGVRNELWIIPTVGCVNSVAQKLAADCFIWFKERSMGVHAFVHPYGCSQMGDDHEQTRRILADLVRHPNAGGVLVLGLAAKIIRWSSLSRSWVLISPFG